MKKKIRVGILFGGQSAEHEVSLVTARNVYEVLDKDKYEVVLIGIDKQGKWHLPSPQQLIAASSSVATASLPVLSETVRITPYTGDKQLTTDIRKESMRNLDVVFPLLHGPMGEDGTVQGLLTLMGLPFVGAGVLGSAVGMDKDVAKRLLRDAGVPVAKFIVHTDTNQVELSFKEIKKQLGLPFFVKPANLGSSVGVSKVHNEKEFGPAIIEAFKYDRKILIEEGINAREIECSVLGNQEMIASVLGEVIPSHEFYDYEAKYIDEEGAVLSIPAALSEKQTKEIQMLAIKTCEVLCVQGMARVDFFVDKTTEKIYVNEVNTIPGFTSISMYPKLWEASGIGYAELIDKLIQLAFDREKK